MESWKTIPAKDVIVIGAGASGMLAAIGAARQGSRVMVLEKEEKPGRKLLATGNGKCNLTNAYQSVDCYYTEDKAFVTSVFQKFGKTETLAFFRELGILTIEKNGYYYPHSGQAETVVRLLQREMESLKVTLKCNERVKKLTKKREGGFSVETDTYTYEGKQVILAAGGCATPTLGSDGSGYMLAKQLGHSITPLYPALTGLVSKESYFQGLAGVRATAKVELFVEGQCIQSQTGEVQLAAYGLSGIPIFQLCHGVCVALAKGKRTEILVDFLPEFTKEEFTSYLEEVKKHSPALKREEVYAGIFDKKLAKVLAKKESKQLLVPICDSRGFSQAQVTAGGVPLSEVYAPRMESKKTKGLYLTGELLDTDGICGGYNLQWAWSTGFLAGERAGKETKEE